MEKIMYWSDLALLIHKTQVAEFGWCSCEDSDEYPYEDCTGGAQYD